jgi:anti-sigma factor RsiW
MLLTILFCKRALFLLPDYLDRELAPQEMSDVRKHLAICHACHEKLAFQSRLVQTMRQELQNQAALELAAP